MAVLTIAAAVVSAHAAWAVSDTSSSAHRARSRIAQVTSLADTEGQQGRDGIALAENCYLDVQEDRMPGGTTVSRTVHECD